MSSGSFVLEVYENERHSLGSFSKEWLLPTDRRQWSTNDAKQFNENDLNDVQLPPGWLWETDTSWVLDTSRGNVDDNHWRYCTDFTAHESSYVDHVTPFCWVRRRRYTRKILFNHKIASRNVEILENERLQFGVYSRQGLLPTDPRNFSSRDVKLNFDSLDDVDREIQGAGWKWGEDSEWVTVCQMESPGDEDDWRYAHDFVHDDKWYTHTSSPLTFIRRRSHKRRLVFSLVAYQEWQMEPAQARNRSENEQFNEYHENWNLVVPPSASLFVGNTSLYIDATFATLGIEEERGRVPIEMASVTNTDTARSGSSNGGGFAAAGSSSGGGGGDAMTTTTTVFSGIPSLAKPGSHNDDDDGQFTDDNNSFNHHKLNPHANSNPSPGPSPGLNGDTTSASGTTNANASADTTATANVTATTNSTTANPVLINQLLIDDDINMSSLRTIDIEL